MSPTAHFPEPVAIDAYGNGGFRFAEMSHKGSLLILPSGVYGWAVSEVAHLSSQDFNPVYAEGENIEFLLFGTGADQIFPGQEIRSRFEEVDIGLEPMSTGAAARTFNVLLAEGRAVAAALIAVD